MRLWRAHPLNDITLTRARGCTVWDSEGKRYVDLLSGVWCNVLGAGHPRWSEAVVAQVGRIAHVGTPFFTAEIGEALSKLSEILPANLSRAVFLNTGSEAVELGIKMALAATGGGSVVVIERGYYGATATALSLSEAGRAAAYLPAFGGRLHRLPLPYCRRCPLVDHRTCGCGDSLACLEPLEALVAAGDERIAAVMYEPVLGAGIFVPPPRYGARLRELATRCDAVLIAEEVTTGMGRTGRWFGFEHDGIVPDIVVIGKAIGNGLPVSAVVSTPEMEERASAALGRHVQSHQNDPFSGRVAATVISIMQDEELVERAAAMGGYLLDGLRTLQSRGPWISDVRGRGAMAGAQLDGRWADLGPDISRQLLQAGFIQDYHAATSTLRLFPPYVISGSEIDAFLRALELVLERTAN